MSQSNYGAFEMLQNAIFLMRTKIIVPSARLLRFPIVIRGKKYINFGKNLTIGARCRFEVHGYHKSKRLIFGNNVNMGYDVRISCSNKIEIGNDVLIGSRVLIIDNSHGTYSGEIQDSPNTPPNKRKLSSKPVVIRDNVWIGENSVIQMGTTVGYGSIIAASTIVTKDVPANSIVAGVPARIIKIYDEQSKEWKSVK